MTELNVRQVRAVELLEEGARRADCLAALDRLRMSAGTAGAHGVGLDPVPGAAPIEIVVFAGDDSYLSIGTSTTFELPSAAISPHTSEWDLYADIIASTIRGMIVERLRIRNGTTVAVVCEIRVHGRRIRNRRWSPRAFLPAQTETRHYKAYCDERS